ncbi:hypothetical protein EON78_05400 [bacterium]|nr:MAG: hypothetical protein EON78_05400 [bacterium]
MKNVIIYTTWNIAKPQCNKLTIESQTKKLRKFSRSKCLKISAEFCDISNDSKSLITMLGWIKTCKFKADTLLFLNWAQFNNDFDNYIELLKLLGTHRILPVAIEEPHITLINHPIMKQCEKIMLDILSIDNDYNNLNKII